MEHHHNKQWCIHMLHCSAHEMVNKTLICAYLPAHSIIRHADFDSQHQMHTREGKTCTLRKWHVVHVHVHVRSACIVHMNSNINLSAEWLRCIALVHAKRV